jgi:RNA polymerase-binding protein DksA
VKAAPVKAKKTVTAAAPKVTKESTATAKTAKEKKAAQTAAPAKKTAVPKVALPPAAPVRKSARRRIKADAGEGEAGEGEPKKKRKYTRRAKKAPAPVPKYQGKQVSLLKKKGVGDAAAVKNKQQRLYSPQDLEYFRVLILDKIKDANEELLSIEDRLMDSATGEYNEDSTYSLHMADQGTDAMEREKAYLFAARERKFISHLTDALQRIKSGNYGLCIVCGDLIEKGRLEAVPHARMCISCKQETKVR